jgi:chromosomal replication initiation ATPase DnaA
MKDAKRQVRRTSSRRRRNRCRAAATDVQGQFYRELDLRQLLESIVAGGFDVEEDRLRVPSRGIARIALARQAAMYLAHVTCSLSKTDAGRLFERDRTTVQHACTVIEQHRDDDEFDLALAYLEQILRIVVGPQEAACLRWW